MQIHSNATTNPKQRAVIQSDSRSCRSMACNLEGTDRILRLSRRASYLAEAPPCACGTDASFAFSAAFCSGVIIGLESIACSSDFRVASAWTGAGFVSAVFVLEAHPQAAITPINVRTTTLAAVILSMNDLHPFV